MRGVRDKMGNKLSSLFIPHVFKFVESEGSERPEMNSSQSACSDMLNKRGITCPGAQGGCEWRSGGANYMWAMAERKSGR
jgi:hypothetical protein